MKKRIKILFFTPYATRTGSEMMLLYILKNLNREHFEAGLVSFAPGEMLKEVPSDIPIFHGPGKYTIFDKISFHLGMHPMERFLDKVVRRFRADLWYVNTIMLSDVVKAANKYSIPVITHVHELSHMFSFISRDEYVRIIKESDLLIGCSETVCNDLRVAGGENVIKLLSFIDLNTINPKRELVASLREQWGVKPGDFVWIMSGTTIERKGFDLLPYLAKIIDDPTVHLVWVGRAPSDALVYLTEKRCEQIKTTKIHMVGAQKEDYYSYLAAADGFMMTSRQEPLGLVIVEAAWLGKPIVSFDSGGPTEFIVDHIGTVVPDLNIRKFVEAMCYWRNNLRQFDQHRARDRAREFGSEIGMKTLGQIICDVYEQV